MHLFLFWFFIGIPALIAMYAVVRTAYRLVTGTMSYGPTELDYFGLVVVFLGVAFGLAWLVGAI